MKKFIKRTVTVLCATVTMAGGIGGLSAGAVTIDTVTTAVNSLSSPTIGWSWTQEGVNKKHTGAVNQEIAGASYEGDLIIFECEHNAYGVSGGAQWEVEGTNKATTARYMGASTRVWNQNTQTYMTAYDDYDSGVTNPGAVVATNSYYYGTLTSAHRLDYHVLIAGTNSTYAPTVEEIILREQQN